MEETYFTKGSILYSRHLIGKTRHMMFKARQKELAPYHIFPQQAHVLILLRDLGRKVTLTELANFTERKVCTLSEQLIKMEKDGLVKKTRETPKSNLVNFELTQKGLSLYDCCKKMRAQKAIMSALSEEERQQLISLLKKLIKKAEKYQ